jgi:hypothetical protein
MHAEGIVQAVVEKVKAVLSQAQQLLEAEVTPERAEQVSRVLTEALSAGWVEGLRGWLKAREPEAATLEIEGTTYRFKLESAKEFLTPGGVMKLSRRIYQPDQGGPCHVPLDAAWGMEGQFATGEVRDAVLYSVALSTPQETATLLRKCALFHPGETAIKALAAKMGAWLEEHEDRLLEEVRAEEEAPEKVRVLCASLDGTNVLLSEAGKKTGRPAERPVAGGAGADAPTCYKNAMVGSITLYGPVPEGKTSPERLRGRYLARMPEDRAPTFKRKFEAELADTQSRLGEDVVRIVLIDGARGLWSYIDEHPAFAGYEKLVDYHHTTEHLSKAAEALFGKGSRAGQRWYEKYAAVLKEQDDGARRVVRSMDYYAAARKLSRARRQSFEAERTFFVNNQARMDYARFRRAGWPIGSGPVEAACKSVVKTRLCRSGMRWSRSGGQHILSLRTYVKSARWDIMWKHYKLMRRAA